MNGPFTIGGPLVFLAGSIYVGLLMGVWALVGVAAYIFVFVIMVRACTVVLSLW